jgi:uncharacterized protein YkwD
VERREHGNDVKFTCLSKNLTRISEEHSIYQIKAGISDNDVPCSKLDDRCARIPYRSGCAENLAGGRTVLKPTNWMNNWLNNSGSRPAIVNSIYDTIGIGIVQDPNTKKYWITALYARSTEVDPDDCINQ